MVGRCKCTKFENDQVRLILDSYSFDMNRPYTVGLNTYHNIKVKGCVKIINKKTDFESIESKKEELVEELNKKGGLEGVQFVILLYVDHKKFDFLFSFFQVKWVKSFPSIVEKVAMVNSKEFEFDIQTIEETDGLVLDKERTVLCDSVKGKGLGKIVLNYILYNKLYTKESIFIVKDALIISGTDENQLQQTAKTLKLVFKKDLELLKTPLLVKVLSQKNINLKSFLSKEQMIEDQSSLNLKLMKWRQEPRLDLDKLSKLKVLMLGSGTLGCNMARLLVAYGVKNITFLDNGHVSYSNLARQSLFNTDSFDKEDKGIPKVEAAKQSLLKISPNCNVKTAHLEVPMPGHYINPDQIDNKHKNLLELEELIKEHDLIFNVFDSREARYFPTILSSLYNKLLFSIGIGYESFVIVRHGNFSPEFHKIITDPQLDIKDETNELTKQLNELKLKNDVGCFFCSDFLPPTDTMSNRTLDQQCTVSRPGISMISCGVAIELAVNSLHKESIGETPHFIRGVIGHEFNIGSYESSRYGNCVACSDFVIREFISDRKGFLLNVLNDPDVLNTYTKFSEQMEGMEEEDYEEILEFDSNWNVIK